MKQFFISLLEKIVKKLKENPPEPALDDFYNRYEDDDLVLNTF